MPCTTSASIASLTRGRATLGLAQGQAALNVSRILCDRGDHITAGLTIAGPVNHSPFLVVEDVFATDDQLLGFRRVDCVPRRVVSPESFMGCIQPTTPVRAWRAQSVGGLRFFPLLAALIVIRHRQRTGRTAQFSAVEAKAASHKIQNQNRFLHCSVPSCGSCYGLQLK